MKKTRIDLVPLLIIAVVFFATAFISFENLIETELLSKSYAFVAGAILLISFVVIFYRDISLRLDRLSIMVIAFIGYLILRMLIAGEYGMKILLMSGFLLFYFAFKVIGPKYTGYINITIILLCFSQAVYGLMQYLGIFHMSGTIGILGSFDNPAGFAAGLSAGLPFCFTIVGKSGPLKWVGIVSGIIIGTAIILSGSRAGMLAIVLAVMVFLITKYRHILKKYRLILPTVLLLLAFLSVGLFFMKKDSALGRVLIWQTSIDMISEAPVIGHSPGAFQAGYMAHQAEWFRNNPDSEYGMLASNVTHPFNEFLLLTIEYGLIGFVILLILISVIVTSDAYTSPYFLSLLSIGVFSFFSYPLRYACVILILAYCLSQINLPKQVAVRMNLWWRVVLLATVSFVGYRVLIDIRFESKWGNLVRLSSLGKSEELIIDYEKLYMSWNGNPLFLYNYGAMLYKTQRYEPSISTMKECLLYFNDYDVQMIMGNCYFELERYEEALDSFTEASLMCPNRFVPLYQMTLVYDVTGQTEKSIELAKIITEKQVKVPSPTVSGIKAKMKAKIQKHSY